MHWHLPMKLLPYRKDIEKMLTTSTRIIGKMTQTTIFDSKFGGNPYWPRDLAYPKNDTGKPLKLALQINLTQSPVVGTSLTTGMLQFFTGDASEIFVMYHHNICSNKEYLLNDYDFMRLFKTAAKNKAVFRIQPFAS